MLSWPTQLRSELFYVLTCYIGVIRARQTPWVDMDGYVVWEGVVRRILRHFLIRQFCRMNNYRSYLPPPLDIYIEPSVRPLEALPP